MDIQCSNEVQQQGMLVNIVPAQILRFDMVCRVCGNENEKNLHIFGADGQNYELALKMNTYLPIKVADNDSLPSNCCWNCATLIFSWHELVVTSIETDRKLKELQIVIAKPLMVSAENAQSESEEVLPHMNSQEVTPVSLSAFYDPNMPPESNLPSSEMLTHQIDKEDIKLSAYTQENNLESARIQDSFSTIELSNKKTVLKPNILKATKVDNVFVKKKDNEEAPKYDFTCEYCGSTFVKDEDILHHMQVQHPNEIDLSETINISQNSTEKKEKRKHTKIDQEMVNAAKVIIDGRVYYNCKLCGKSLYSPYTYLWHIRIHTGERPYVCDLCGKQFRVAQGLTRHLRETHEGIKKFGCDICGRMFSTRRNAEEHRRTHTNERPYICALCGKAFKQKSSLFVHNRSHTDHFPYGCSYCDLRFRTKPPLLVHVTRHTGERPYPCEECGRCFRVKYELKRHMLVHSDEKPFVCGECGLSFRQKRYLRNHTKTNHNRLNTVYENSSSTSNTVALEEDKVLRSTDSQDIQKQTCRTNSFPKEDVLLNQKRRLCKDAAKENTSSIKNLPSSSNTQNFNFICNVCDKYFTTKRSLVRHQKNLHKKYEKQIYRCKSCPAQFTDENEYYSHIEKIHFEVRDPMNTQTERSSKFFCNICNNGYIRKNELKKHIRIKHLVSSTKLQKKRTNLAKYKVTLNNEVFYQCDVCENRYRQAYNLSRHKLIHVNGIHSYMCDICGKQYNTKSSLRRHCTETHTTNRFSCKICNAQFRAKVSLVQHLNIHNDNRPFVCDICGKAFRQDSSLRIHKMYHTTNFRFTCKVCGKEYRRNNELKVHMTLHTGVKAYNCTLCEKTFRLSSTLRKHVKLHDRLETCWCEICGAPFSQLRYLKNHQRCHQNTINMDNEEQETVKDDVGLKDSSGQ